jgi:hypothetical protein
MTVLVDQNIEFFAGNSYEINDMILKSDGSVKDITLAELKFVLFDNNINLVLVTKTIGSGITLTDPTNGKCRVELLPEDTEDISPGDWYRYEIQVIDEFNKVSVVTTGAVSLLRSLS